jgi:hypothetical protein
MPLKEKFNGKLAQTSNSPSLPPNERPLIIPSGNPLKKQPIIRFTLMINTELKQLA